MKEIFSGVFREGKRLYTIYDNKQRDWNPEKSKLSAAIINGLNELSIKEDSIVLYLGASTGTTVSHVSDIVGTKGLVYAIEFSERVFHSLLDLSEKRRNIAPLLADARKPETYSWVEEVDVIYIDVADPQETELAIRNAKMFLKGNSLMYIAIKSQSIDVTKDPKHVYKEESEKLRASGFEILQLIDLEPYEEKHGMIVARMKA